MNECAKFESRNRLRRGQGMVELALTLPIFLIVVMGLIDLAYRFNVQLSLDDIATSAAIYGATKDISRGYPAGVAYDPNNPYDYCPTKTEIQNFVKNYNRPPIKGDQIGITVEEDWSPMAGQKCVRVTLTYTITPMTPAMSVYASSWVLTSQAIQTKAP